MTLNRKWTDEDIRILKERYPYEHTDVVADALGRSEDQVRSKASKIGLRKADDYDYTGNYGKYVHKGLYSDNRWGTAKC